MLNLIPCVKPIQLWHGNIEDDDIGFQFARKSEQRSPVIHDSGNFELRLEKTLTSFCQQRVVVGNEQPSSVMMFHCIFPL